MNAIIKSFHMLFKQISRDGMLFMALFAPILAALFFRFGIPSIESLLTEHFEKESIISDYYGLIDLFLATLTPYMFCFLAAMTMLDEYDNNIIHHLSITPVRKKGYLISRLVIPTAIAFLYSLVNMLLFSLVTRSISMMILISLLTSIMSISQALLIFSFSKNKVEGMAIAKLSGIVMMGLFIPYFIKQNAQYYFSFLPSFWIAKFWLNPKFIFFILAFLLSIVFYGLLYNKFDKKISS